MKRKQASAFGTSGKPGLVGGPDPPSFRLNPWTSYILGLDDNIIALVVSQYIEFASMIRIHCCFFLGPFIVGVQGLRSGGGKRRSSRLGASTAVLTTGSSAVTMMVNITP